MSSLQTYLIDNWEKEIPEVTQVSAMQALEKGQVLYFPHLSFPLEKIFG